MNLEAAANLLEHLLDRVDGSLEGDGLLEVRGELIEFKRELPWEPEFAELRRIATDAFDELGRTLNQSALNRMRARGRELAKHVETLSAITSRAEKNRETLRLRHVQAVTTAAKEVADAVRAAQASIAANDLPAASEKTEEALGRLLRLMEEISEVG